MRNGAKNRNVPTRNANAIRRSVCIDQNRHITRHRLFSGRPCSDGDYVESKQQRYVWRLYDGDQLQKGGTICY